MNNEIKLKIEDFQKLLVVNRINILELLVKNETCVCQMVKALNLKHNLISHHLKTLLDMGYVTSTRNGQHIMYGLTDSKREIVSDLLKIIYK